MLHCITVQNSTRECEHSSLEYLWCEAQEKQKITHMQNLASQFTKLYDQLFKFL